MTEKTEILLIDSNQNNFFNEFFFPRLNPRKGMFTTLFTQANPNTIYGSIFENNMDEASITNWEESLIRTITLPRQAYGGWLSDVKAISDTACKVSLYVIFFHSRTVILISINTHVA